MRNDYIVSFRISEKELEDIKAVHDFVEKLSNNQDSIGTKIENVLTRLIKSCKKSDDLFCTIHDKPVSYIDFSTNIDCKPYECETCIMAEYTDL